MRNVELPQAEELWIACVTCGRRNCHRVLAAVRDVDGDDHSSLQWWDDHLIVECGGCKTISFVHTSKSTDNTEFDHSTGEEFLVPTERLYPPRIGGLRKFERAYHLPANIGRIYSETLDAINGNLPILAGIGIRAIVETVCKEEKASGRNLEKKLEKLAEKGVVTAAGAEILHGLRFMGNAAAHEVRAHTEEELTIAVEVVENLLKGVYVIPKRARKLLKGA
jgi:hypothetical protein